MKTVQSNDVLAVFRPKNGHELLQALKENKQCEIVDTHTFNNQKMKLDSKDLDPYRHPDKFFRNDVKFWVLHDNNNKEGMWGTVIQYNEKTKKGVLTLLNDSIFNRKLIVGSFVNFELNEFIIKAS